MEKYLQDRREKLAAALVLLAAGKVVLEIRKGRKTGTLLRYPGGSFFADIRDNVTGKLERFSYRTPDDANPSYDFDDVEHTEDEIRRFGNFFDVPEDASESE